MPASANKPLRPNRAWCTEVAELDEQLFGLGLPDISTSFFRPSRRRTFHFHGHTHADSFIFDSGRGFARWRHLGSVILWLNEYDPNVPPGHTAIRSVSYQPSLIYGRPPTHVYDQSFSVANLPHLLSADSTAEQRQEAGALIRADWRMQQAAGMSLPTAETYAFILGALRLGEQSTRPTDAS